MSGVLVILETAAQRSGTFNRMSFEAVAAARQLSEKLNLPLAIAALGDKGSAPSTWEIGALPTASYLVQHELLEPYTSDAYVIALEQLIRPCGLKVEQVRSMKGFIRGN